jgi:hypothetical protein
MLRGNRQELSGSWAGRIIVGAELLQPFGYAPTPCSILRMAIHEPAPPIMS